MHVRITNIMILFFHGAHSNHKHARNELSIKGLTSIFNFYFWSRYHRDGRGSLRTQRDSDWTASPEFRPAAGESVALNKIDPDRVLLYNRAIGNQTGKTCLAASSSDQSNARIPPSGRRGQRSRIGMGKSNTLFAGMVLDRRPSFAHHVVNARKCSVFSVFKSISFVREPSYDA